MLARLLVLLGVVAAVAVVAPTVAPMLLAAAMGDAGGPPVPGTASDAPATSAHRATLRADRLGNFAANAVINGQSTEMIVDTGASVVALTPATAHRLGIHPAAGDYSIGMATANGVASAAAVVLDEVRIGDVTVREVPAVVFAGEGLGVDLLGMTFLKRLTRFEAGGGQLVLVQ